MTPLQKLPKNVKTLGILIVAKGFKKLAKVQKIAQSAHTEHHTTISLHFTANFEMGKYSFCLLQNCAKQADLFQGEWYLEVPRIGNADITNERGRITVQMTSCLLSLVQLLCFW